MIRFETESGSTYEVDPGVQRIRRVSGTRAPARRQGEDGEWKHYADITPIEVGSPVFIYWPRGTPLLEGSPSYARPATVTSVVVRVST